MTGKPYMVICNGVKISTSEWLKAKLDKLMTNKISASEAAERKGDAR